MDRVLTSLRTQSGQPRDAWPRRLLLGVAVAGLAGVVLALAALDPPAAHADKCSLTDPLQCGSDVIGGVGDALGGLASSAAVGALKDILKFLFGGLQARITQGVLAWLVAVPDVAGGNVRELVHTTSAIAFGLMTAVMTLAVARYWLAGLTSSGGLEGLEGVARTLGAAAAIAAWPTVLPLLTRTANAASSALLHSGSVGDDLTRLFRAALIGGAFNPGAGVFISIVIAVLGGLLLVALLVLKVVVSLTTVLLFVGMPVALVLWPLGESAWVSRWALRLLGVCLAVPFVWVLIFATFAAVGTDALSLHGGGGAIEKAFVQPLVGVALLFVTIVAPRALARAAMVGDGGGRRGLVGGAVRYAAGRATYAAAAAHLPGVVGGAGAGRRSGPVERLSSGESGRGGGSGGGTGGTGGGTSAPRPSRPGGPDGGGASPVPAASSPGSSAQPPVPMAAMPVSERVDEPYSPRAAEPTVRENGDEGLPPVAWAAVAPRVAAERERIAGLPEPTVTHAARAAAQLTPAQRRDVSQLVAEDRHRPALTEQTASGQWAPAERDALRLLAAAPRPVAAEGLRLAGAPEVRPDWHTNPVSAAPVPASGTSPAVSRPPVQAGASPTAPRSPVAPGSAPSSASPAPRRIDGDSSSSSTPGAPA